MDSEIRIPIPYDAIVAFCETWKITEFALFGSVLRDDFRLEDSDVDVLVTYALDARWSLWEHARMVRELEEIFGRSVDLAARECVESSPESFAPDIHFAVCSRDSCRLIKTGKIGTH